MDFTDTRAPIARLQWRQSIGSVLALGLIVQPASQRTQLVLSAACRADVGDWCGSFKITKALLILQPGDGDKPTFADRAVTIAALALVAPGLTRHADFPDGVPWPVYRVKYSSQATTGTCRQAAGRLPAGSVRHELAASPADRT